MNIFRTSAASYFNLDDGTSGAPVGGGSAPAGGSSTPMSSSPSASSSAPATSTPNGSSGVANLPGGGSAAPNAAPSASSADPFAGLDNDDWGTEEIEIVDAATGTEPGAPPQPGAQPAPAAAAPPADGNQPPPPAVSPVAAPAASPPANAGSGRSPLDEAIEGFKANQAALTDWAAGEIFKLTPEEQTALDTDAQSMIPKLMSRTYVQGLIAAKNLIKNFVPQMIASEVERITTTTKRSSEALDQFYGAHKELDRTQHQPVVDKWLKSFRAANPKASRQEAIDFVGRAVKIELGIANGAPAASSAPRAAPFAPARQGGRAPATNSQPHDPYAGLDFDFGEEVQ